MVAAPGGVLASARAQRRRVGTSRPAALASASASGAGERPAQPARAAACRSRASCPSRTSRGEARAQRLAQRVLAAPAAHLLRAPAGWRSARRSGGRAAARAPRATRPSRRGRPWPGSGRAGRCGSRRTARGRADRRPRGARVVRARRRRTGRARRGAAASVGREQRQRLVARELRHAVPVGARRLARRRWSGRCSRAGRAAPSRASGSRARARGQHALARRARAAARTRFSATSCT